MTSIDTASTGEHAGRLEIVQVDLPAMVDVDRLTSLRRLGRITAVVGRRLVPVIVTNFVARDSGKLFLGDESLIYDPDVYRTLLAATREPAA